MLGFLKLGFLKRLFGKKEPDPITVGLFADVAPGDVLVRESFLAVNPSRRMRKVKDVREAEGILVMEDGSLVRIADGSVPGNPNVRWRRPLDPA